MVKKGPSCKSRNGSEGNLLGGGRGGGGGILLQPFTTLFMIIGGQLFS